MKLFTTLAILFQWGMKELCLVEAIVEIWLLVVETMALVAIAFQPKVLRNDYADAMWRYYARLLSWTFSYFYSTFCIVSSLKLYSYANQKNFRAYRHLLTISYIFYAICCLDLVLYTIFLGWINPATSIAFFGFLFYKVYFFWLAERFLKKFKKKGGDYHHDQGTIITKLDTISDRSLHIPRESLTPDYSTLLGEGVFGQVYKAFLHDGNRSEFVALKIPRHSTDFLPELKILARLRRHENIVHFIGSYTHSDELSLIFELCEEGNLQNFLRKHRNALLSYLEVQAFNKTLGVDAGGYICNKGVVLRYRLPELVRWSAETASGMEFISRRKIVHRDLSAKNVLLDKNLVAKISDFGLSRNLWDEKNYITRTMGPLPWRWMPPEALIRMEFSTLSDIWAYGVLLWEIFSLGRTPYGDRICNDKFLSGLQTGRVRLEKPHLASDSIYELMLACWNIDQNKRPSFADVVKIVGH
ncbi:tyrosine-protein kinase receptor Tie-2-like [Folsomia candida]|uniref:tyrosine-protein kinase receptor Tie-2-like n=1 Tax=Folsomia candida TaxID=158441 RepID=UPI001605415E|nr:tyrosine-protein kinase receptor Tie-2-like [Folsomia candida]